MAGTSSPRYGLAFLCLCYYMLVHCIHVAYAVSFAFSFSTNNTNPCGIDLQCRGDASFSNHMMELTINDVLRKRENSKGRVWYARPVPLWDNATSEVASFATTFDFKIEPDPSKETLLRDKNIYPYGDGMAFFLAPYSDDVLGSGDGGGTLGLVNNSNIFNATGDRSFVAVEFDTYQNQDWDTSNQHVGIDVNSIMSVASTETIPEGDDIGILVSSNLTMTARISYDNRTKLLAVDFNVTGTSFHVNNTVDLRKLLPEKVAVGFSAATGWAAELHRVLFWSFNSTLEEKKPVLVLPPAPAPLTASLKSEPSVKVEPSSGLLLQVVAPVLAVSVCAALGLLLCLRRLKKRRSESDLERGVAGPRRYYYRELAAATGDFSDESRLGRGGFGSVYQGTLVLGDDNRQLVAVKKLSSGNSCQGRKEFEAEVRIISRIRHRNLVQLLGWCDSAKGLLLVYELMPEGSLDKLIHNNPRLLTWSERYKIIMGLGSALSYLHSEMDQCVVHGDIKPSNIMLDSSYNTKLGDFGLARLIDHEGSPRMTETILGTAGYIDPDLVDSLRPSPQSDVYSFGIVLLEIISARQPVVTNPPFVLLKWVWSLYSRGATIEAVDTRLRGDGANDRAMERALVVGLWCAHHAPGARPSITDAMRVLQSEDAKLPELPQYRCDATPALSTIVSMGEIGGVSGSFFSSEVRSSATTGTTHSSE